MLTPLHVAGLGLAAGTLSAAAAGLPGWWVGLVVGAGYAGYRVGRRSVPVVSVEPAPVAPETQVVAVRPAPEPDVLEELRIERAAISMRQNQARKRLGELFDLVTKMRAVDARLYAHRIQRCKDAIELLRGILDDDDVELRIVDRTIAMAEIERDSAFLDEVAQWREVAAEHAERRLLAEANEELERFLATPLSVCAEQSAPTA